MNSTNTTQLEIKEIHHTNVVPFEWGTRTAWAEVIEAESPTATKSGSYSVLNVGPGDWNSGVCLFSTNSYIEAAFSGAADTLVVQFESDANDGIAEFIVDNVSVGTLDTYNGGWFGVEISGLAPTTHTLRVRAAGASSTGGQDDIAIDVLGAKVTSSGNIREPTTLALMGLGLAGIGYRGSQQDNRLNLLAAPQTAPPWLALVGFFAPTPTSLLGKPIETSG